MEFGHARCSFGPRLLAEPISIRQPARAAVDYFHQGGEVAAGFVPRGQVQPIAVSFRQHFRQQPALRTDAQPASRARLNRAASHHRAPAVNHINAEGSAASHKSRQAFGLAVLRFALASAISGSIDFRLW
jgi:hypothetical protein